MARSRRQVSQARTGHITFTVDEIRFFEETVVKEEALRTSFLMRKAGKREEQGPITSARVMAGIALGCQCPINDISVCMQEEPVSRHQNTLGKTGFRLTPSMLETHKVRPPARPLPPATPTKHSHICMPRAVVIAVTAAVFAPRPPPLQMRVGEVGGGGTTRPHTSAGRSPTVDVRAELARLREQNLELETKVRCIVGVEYCTVAFGRSSDGAC